MRRSATLDIMKPSSSHRPDWIEISIRSDPSTHEAVSAFLLETLGCEGVVTDVSSGTIKAYLPAGSKAEDLEIRIETFLSGLGQWFPTRARLPVAWAGFGTRTGERPGGGTSAPTGSRPGS
jgi:hypothetical protein